MDVQEDRSLDTEAMSKGSNYVKNLTMKIRKLPASVCRSLWTMGRDDPRRVIHGLKVGTALTLVSFLYLLEPLFKGVGQNAMWAVMTVVVVLEYTAGEWVY